MCSVSVISEWGQTIPMQQWTRPAFDQFKEVLDRLDILDAKLSQPDCEDPAKAAWMREVEARLEKIEKRKS